MRFRQQLQGIMSRDFANINSIMNVKTQWQASNFKRELPLQPQERNFIDPYQKQVVFVSVTLEKSLSTVKFVQVIMYAYIYLYVGLASEPSYGKLLRRRPSSTPTPYSITYTIQDPRLRNVKRFLQCMEVYFIRRG